MHLQKDGTHTCRKAMENKGLVLVPNNMFDTCLQTQQPFWRKSIFPCLAAGSVLLGQLRLFVSGWSPTCSCCQNSYQYTQFSMRHVIPLLQLNSICPPSLRCSPSFLLLCLHSSPVAVAHGFPPLCQLCEIRFYSTCCVYRGWSLPAQKPLSRLWDVCENEV